MTDVAVQECPICGSPMVRTVARQGPREGLPLWRCSDLECRGLVNIDGSLTPAAPPLPGESAQARFERERAARNDRIRLAAPFLAGVAVLASALSFWVTSVWLGWPFPFAAAALAIVAFILLLSRLTPEIVDWKHGAEAERRVGVSLDALRPLGFVTLYDRAIRGRGGNIDAVTVGPQGVFLVETKWRKRGVEVVNGRMEVGGREQSDAVRQATELAMLVQVALAPTMNRLRMTVSPVICIGNKSVERGSRSGGVPVVDRKTIGPYLSGLPVLLSADDVQTIATELDFALPAYQRRT
jgi:Nuclease-related domain